MPTRIAILLLCVCAASALAAQGAGHMGAVEIMDGLTSHDAAQRDRASNALKAIDADAARALGREIAAAGTRDGRVALEHVARANTGPACLAAAVALESEHQRTRHAALDVFSRVGTETIERFMRWGFTVRQRNILRELIDDPDFMRGFCLSGMDGETYASRLLRKTVFLDRVFGPSGWCAILQSLLHLMESGADDPADADDDADDEAEAPDNESTQQGVDAAKARQHTQMRVAASEAFETIWATSIAAQFTYMPRAMPETRASAVKRMREHVAGLPTVEVETAQGRRVGMRYGDYLQSLFNHDVNEVRAAAYLRLRWMKDDTQPIAGAEYAKAVEAFNTMSRRDVANLRRELRTWWGDFRARNG